MTSASRPPRDYEAYGLSVRSPFPLPFLPLPVHRAGKPDVTVRIGATPAALPSPNVKRALKRAFKEITPGAFLLSVDDVARFLVTNGRDVLVEPCGGEARPPVPARRDGGPDRSILAERGGRRHGFGEPAA